MSQEGSNPTVVTDRPPPPWGDKPAMRGARHYAATLRSLLRGALGQAVWPEHEGQADREPYSYPDARWIRSYSPALDLAVGPFASGTDVGPDLERRYADLLSLHHGVFDRLLAAGSANVRAFGSDQPAPDAEGLRVANAHARCLVAVEIERRNIAAKYLAGSALSASSWGKVGVVVCWPERLHPMLRIREALCAQDRAKGGTMRTGNLLVLSYEQIVSALAG